MGFGPDVLDSSKATWDSGIAIQALNDGLSYVQVVGVPGGLVQEVCALGKFRSEGMVGPYHTPHVQIEGLGKKVVLVVHKV